MSGYELESLPGVFPIFPLSGALLLPNGHLPLNIFEPRYLAMTRDAMRTERIIGMIQPVGPDTSPPPVYKTGCAGRITNFRETDDGRYLINLTGVCRFDVLEELDVATPYRQIRADFERFLDDLDPQPPSPGLRDGLLDAVRRYFDTHQISADWDAIHAAPLPGLITSLAMICPFEPSEKQALLEAPSLDARGRVLTTLFEMGATGGSQDLRH
ncbi:LON peptidase substrate-binding domain-containing protein [Marinivivus vitaminiproducens]|uniref:LON peptidase substrate-binding domain-containing protein n=1 Tax=Marinivivus vitaminiproducens TaxID=3035935 RepID=UPI0027A08747|nr:LON peptidase substrate-binding domain-containing protein [Geminicoccaceae bacterium SCSIO 64248]